MIVPIATGAAQGAAAAAQNVPIVFSAVADPVAAGLVAVSYTHLDVYKRQGYGRRAGIHQQRGHTVFQQQRGF